jgi:hypothetical protein
MKPVVWRIFRNNRWSYADVPSGGIHDRAAWQPLYAAEVLDAGNETCQRAMEFEREACAKLCEDQMQWGEINPTIAIAAGNCADLIRARGQS